MKQEEIEKEINRIQTFLGDGFEVTKCNGAIRVDKKIQLPKVEYMGWDYGKKYHMQLYFNFNKFNSNTLVLQEIGDKLAKHLEEYLSE